MFKITWNRTASTFDCVWTKTILILNWIVWIRTVWLNWIAWNRNVFGNLSVYLCLTEFFEIEVIISIKMYLALNNLQRLICHKTRTTNNQRIILFNINYLFAHSLKYCYLTLVILLIDYSYLI